LKVIAAVVEQPKIERLFTPRVAAAGGSASICVCPGVASGMNGARAIWSSAD
jgi:hypothetical protein